MGLRKESMRNKTQWAVRSRSCFGKRGQLELFGGGVSLRCDYLHPPSQTPAPSIVQLRQGSQHSMPIMGEVILHRKCHKRPRFDLFGAGSRGG